MSDTQHSSDDSLRRLFLQLHQPATSAGFEREVMQKVRIAAQKQQQPKLWKVQSTLIAAAAATLFAAATWMAIAVLGEPQLSFDALGFEAAGQQLAHRCSAGLLLLLHALSQKEVACLMVAVAVIAIATCLSSRKDLSTRDS